ncbi:MAG TPA: 3'(2'),5'-bisphosphate nucleotidase, partial [Chthonomonadales bacterium]|nr:3'(2'),5'-bisphosphate nucleotidase [Chthonomonadales bacterium]
MNLTSERTVTIEAVLKACRLCEAVRAEMVSEETLMKKDRSPVTVADYGAQAILSLALERTFPHDPIVGEEDTTELRTGSGRAILERVVHFVRAEWPEATEEETLHAIARGNYAGGAVGRYWTMDPIDGTKGFLRGEQYAVALALIQDGEVVLSALGCPNLPLDTARPNGPKGCLFVAVKGEGAFVRAPDSNRETPIHVSDIADPAQAAFCESVEATHSAQGDAARIAKALGIKTPPMRIDSQAKYAAVARGDAAIYLRLPTSALYEEKIWDHAPGWLIIREAGGEVT